MNRKMLAFLMCVLTVVTMLCGCKPESQITEPPAQTESAESVPATVPTEATVEATAEATQETEAKSFEERDEPDEKSENNPTEGDFESEEDDVTENVPVTVPPVSAPEATEGNWVGEDGAIYDENETERDI